MLIAIGRAIVSGHLLSNCEVITAIGRHVQPKAGTSAWDQMGGVDITAAARATNVAKCYLGGRPSRARLAFTAGQQPQ